MYLNDIWALYFHDPYNMNWDEKSYKFIGIISTVEEFINIYIIFKELWCKGMFFIMREHIQPRWEDEHNKNGGCFSFKVTKQELEEKWFNICCNTLGETISNNNNFTLNVNGVSISPKKNYYIIRLWLKDNKKANKENYILDIPKYSILMYKIHTE